MGKQKNNKMLKVGFDLDGVILYNPIRIFRPVIYLVKRLFIKKKVKTFWIPKKPWEKLFFRLAHKTSLFIVPGYYDIKKLVKEKKIKAYLITGRFGFLKPDLENWLKKMDIDKVFSEIYYNEKDEQPHLFKERLIDKLGLDIFIEDNWNIVNHLNIKNRGKIYWIYNLLDKKIIYQYKFASLRKAVLYISNIIHIK